MKILITGNMGYVGSVLAEHLRRRFPDSCLIGYDTGYFSHCLTGAARLPESYLDKQYFGDVRKVPDHVFGDLDAVVELAAVSNDPMGDRFRKVTEDINHNAVSYIAIRAIQHGVKRIVFASSCSMYGFAADGARKEGDPLNPLTVYAKSKVAAEQDLERLQRETDAVITSLRFSTACGMSPRLRLDLVLNDFVACAIANREITVLSDGTPWRPLIDVRDMARAIEWALVRDPKEAGSYVAVNVGADSWNYQVKDLAAAVEEIIPGTVVYINTEAPPDGRSYKVDFSLYASIAHDYPIKFDLLQSISSLKAGLEDMGFRDRNFRSSQYMRLKVLERHMSNDLLDENLDWKI